MWYKYLMDVKKPIPNKYVNAGLAYLHRKDTHSNQNTKGKQEKSDGTKSHRLIFLQKRNVNEYITLSVFLHVPSDTYHVGEGLKQSKYRSYPNHKDADLLFRLSSYK